MIRSRLPPWTPFWYKKKHFVKKHSIPFLIKVLCSNENVTAVATVYSKISPDMTLLLVLTSSVLTKSIQLVYELIDAYYELVHGS